MSSESDGVGVTAKRRGDENWEYKGMKELSEGKKKDRHEMSSELSVTALTFGRVFVLFPRLVGLFEAVVAHEAG